jgi:hypothetical protein
MASNRLPFFSIQNALTIASPFAAVASLVLYLLCLVLPCYAPCREPGIGLLLFGAIGVFCGQFPWLANPCYFVAIVGLTLSFSESFTVSSTLTCCRIATIVSPMGVLFALIFLFQSKTLYGNHPVGVLVNIEELLFGFWSWLSALFVLSLSVLFRYATMLMRLRKSERLLPERKSLN